MLGLREERYEGQSDLERTCLSCCSLQSHAVSSLPYISCPISAFETSLIGSSEYLSQNFALATVMIANSLNSAN